MRQLSLFDRLARARGLDGVAGALRTVTQRVLRPGAVKDLLHGVWLGHPLHPALAQLPVGCFLGAAVLDGLGDRDDGARKLIWCGLASSAPAALAGLADYADSHEEQQRMGLVHALANSAALACYATSLRLRATGRAGLGVALGFLGLSLAGGSAALGGDLAFRHAVGPNHAAEVPHTGPGQWCDLGPVDDFTESEPTRRQAGLIPVLVLRRGMGFTVLHDRCSHMAAPLHQGEIGYVNGELCLTCPWHGSVFRIEDGAVVHGPATAPQPVLDNRIQAGRLQTRVREIPGVPAS